MIRFGTEVKLDVTNGVAAIGEKLDLLVHLETLGLKVLMQTTLGFVVVSAQTKSI